jgi:hypothetical protein
MSNDIDTFYHSRKPVKLKNFKLVCGIHIKYITEFFAKKYIDVSNPHIKISLIFPINEYRHNFEPLGYSEDYFYVFLDIDCLESSALRHHECLKLSALETEVSEADAKRLRDENSDAKRLRDEGSFTAILNKIRLKSLELVEKQKTSKKGKYKFNSYDSFLPFRDGFSRFDSGCPKTEIKFNENIPFYYISYIYVDMLYMNKKNKEIIDSHKTLYASLWKIVN